MGRGEEQGAVERRAEERFAKMMEGRREPAGLRAPGSEPPWLDKEAARRGRQVYMDCNAAISLSSMEALLMGMCIPNFYKPLVFTRLSHGKQLATDRYLDTAALVYSWYQADAWEAESLTSTMIRRVNAMHRNIAGKVRPLGLELLDERVQEVWREDQVDTEASLTGQDKIFLESVAELRDQTEISADFWKYVNDSSLFSQMDMTLVQGAFFGQFLLFPEAFGASWVSQDQVSDFLHLWRTNGWYLGVGEDNNAVMETVEETRAAAKLVLERILKPCMLYISPDSLHMARAALFPGMDYHVVTYSNYELVGLPLPRLWASFSYWQRAQYYFRQWYACHVYTLPVPRYIANWLGQITLGRLLANYQTRGRAGPKRKGE